MTLNTIMLASLIACCCSLPALAQEKTRRDLLPFQPNVPLSSREGRSWQPPGKAVPLDGSWQKSSPYMSLSTSDRLEEATAGYNVYDSPISHGLIFDLVAGRDWPELRMPCAIGVGRHPEVARRTNRESVREYVVWTKSFKLGKMRIPGMQPGIDELESDWSHNTLLFGDSEDMGLRVTVSRLTPAILIESDSPSVELFADAAMPTLWACGAGENQISQGSLMPGAPGDASENPADAMQDGWMLVWHGETSPFLTFPFPISYRSEGYMHGQDTWHAQQVAKNEFIPADCPMLLVFQNQPASVSLDKGLLLDFASGLGGDEDKVGRIALLPLFGLKHPERSVTAKWTGGLPADVVEACRQWAGHLSRFPLTVVESYAFVPAGKTTTVTESFEFADLRDDESWLAPVPPMLALAARMGLEMKFSGELTGEGCITAVGPAAGIKGVESYTWSIPDLAKYALERRALSANHGNGHPELQARLEAETKKILDAGPLDPWFFLAHDMSGFGAYHFSRTGETLRFLAPVLDLLPADLAAKTLEYLKAERLRCAPELCLNLPVYGCARREYWIADEKIFGSTDDNAGERRDGNMSAVTGYNPGGRWLRGIGYWFDPIPVPTNERVPVRDLYGLWALLAATGEKPDDATWANCKACLMATAAGHEWATMGWFQRAGEVSAVDGHCSHRSYMHQYNGGVMAANSYFGGLVGFIRMARMRNDAEAEAFGWGMFSRAAALSFAMRKFTGYMYQAGAIRIPPWAEKEPDWMPRRYLGDGYLWAMEWTKPEHDVRQVNCMDERGVNLLESNSHHLQAYLVGLMHLTPELGRFLADKAPAEIEAYYRRISEDFPDWHLTRAETRLGGDKSHFRDTTDAYQVFMSRAWVAGDAAEALARRLDVPHTARGDLYWIEKLAETVRADRGAEWVAAGKEDEKLRR